MNSIGLEYVNRTGLAQYLLSLPCSVFLSNFNDTDRSVVVINLSEERYLIRRWFLSKCEYTHTMPPFEEFFVEDVFSETEKIFGENHIMKYQSEEIPSFENSQTAPMSEVYYKNKFNNFLNSCNHSIIREYWLWNSFLTVYHPDIISIVEKLNSELGLRISMDDEKFIVETKFPRTWKYWEAWKRNMLDFDSNVPAELVFSNIHKKTFDPVINYSIW